MAQTLRPMSVGTTKQLFLDNEIIEDTWGLKRTYFAVTKHPGNPVLCRQYPWEEGGLRLYGTVLRENGLFRMWYEGHVDEPRRCLICYATSQDGLMWERPPLGIVDFMGLKDNNVVFQGDGNPSGATVVRDDEDPDPVRRYKMVYGGRTGVGLAFSPDGLHWAQVRRISQQHNDMHMVLVRATEGTKWLLFGRPDTYAGHWKRRVAISESTDLENWTELSTILLPDELDPPEFYYMVPFCYEGMYIGLLGPYRSATSSSIDVQIASSRDARHWQRPVRREPFIPLGKLGQFDSHIIWMSSAPVRVGDELWFYYSGFDGRHDWRGHQARIGLGTLRLDGFVCLDATDPITVGEAVAAARVDLPPGGGPVTEQIVWPDEGVMITRPFVWEGERLEINAWAPRGNIRVEVIDATTPISSKRPAHGSAVEGLELAMCDPFSGDKVSHVVAWSGRTDLSALKGRPVRLKFVLRAARLFCFQPAGG